MTSTKISKIDPGDFSLDPIREAVRVVRTGGVVAYPTTCLYGLGADAFNPRAIEKVFRIKKRPLDKPLSILIKDRASIVSLVREILPVAQAVMDQFWPGEVTAVFEAGDGLPEALTAGTGKIGIRVPAHPVAAALLDVLDCPLTATSANITGRTSCSNIADLDPRIKAGVDLVLDAGSLRGGIGTTVIDVSVDPPRVLREGAISEADLMEAIDNHV